MHKKHGVVRKSTSSLVAKWLVGSFSLGLVIAAATMWLRSQTSENKSGLMEPDAINISGVVQKASQKFKDAKQTSKEQILETEAELQPGG